MLVIHNIPKSQLRLGREGLALLAQLLYICGVMKVIVIILENCVFFVVFCSLVSMSSETNYIGWLAEGRECKHSDMRGYRIVYFSGKDRQ